MVKHINSAQSPMNMILKRDTFIVLSFLFGNESEMSVFIKSQSTLSYRADFWAMHVPPIYHPLPQALHSQTATLSKGAEQKEGRENFVHSVNQTDTPLGPNAEMLFSL